MLDVGVSRPSRPSKLPFALFTIWIAVLALSGGASRIDVLGQFLVRGIGWGILLFCVVALPKLEWRANATVGWFLLATAGLVTVQLIPLPPSLWQNLPGRELLRDLDSIIEHKGVWRPISLSPGWTLNALGSLIAVATTFVLAIALGEKQRAQILPHLLIAAVGSSVLALLQYSGANVDHPLVNDVPGEVSGFFANRNHFALMLAIACAIVPVWAFGRNPNSDWRILSGAGMLLLFMPMVLASGSRAGTLLAIAGVLLGVLAVRRPAWERLKRVHIWRRVSVLAAGVALFGGTLFTTFLFGRAASIDRVIDIGAEDGVRRDAYATVIEMILTYFPVGTGFGTFDPAYRIAEPSNALRPQYLNQAHSDVLQVALEGGVAALALLTFAIIWWLRKSWRAWASDDALLARLGSITILMILLASVVDYPARTPMVMALATLGAIWLNNAPSGRRGLARTD